MTMSPQTVIEYGVGILAALAALYFLHSSIKYIPNTKVGIVEKLISRRGSVTSGFIALNGEAGYQPEVLRGGMHFLTPFIYRVHQLPLVTISQGEIGYVFARDGKPLESGQTLGSTVTGAGSAFEDVRAFLANGGQRGPQRKILREGTYAINLVQFVVITRSGVHGLGLNSDEEKLFVQMIATIEGRQGFAPVLVTKDIVGIVTVHDGPGLLLNDIIAPAVNADNFQDADAFLQAGGRRGRQLQVLVEGTFFINRLFATVEAIPKTVVEVGYVGVVVSYTGDAGADLSGQGYGHGEMVEQGKRGVWQTPLMPGKYAFNTFAGQVIMVPTTNIILKWLAGQSGAHKLDENLAEVSLITKDAFEPSLPLSVVIHIDYRQAPLVIQRFGDIKKLVEQTLDPMVSAYFKNIGQVRTLIQLIQERSWIQKESGEAMKAKFAEYNLELQEVLIGTPHSQPGDDRIEKILVQLRDRQVAREQIETYSAQEGAAVKERELRETQARAKQQTSITESELSIVVHENEGKAALAQAVQDAAKVRTLAEADAYRVKQAADAEATRTAQVGIAQAMAIEEQVRAYGGPRYQLTEKVMGRFAEAIEAAHVDVVPRVLIGGQGDQSAQGGLIQALLAMLLAEGTETASEPAASSPMADAIRTKLRAAMKPDDMNGGAKS